MLRSTKLLTLLSFLSMFFLGVGSTIIGAAARNIGWTPSQIGFMLALEHIGFMLAVILSGALADAYDKTKILFFGSLLLAFALYAFYLHDSFLLNLFVMFFVGAGIGSYEGVADTMLLEIHQERENLYINVNHFFVTFGCLMITLYLLFLQMNWRRAIVQSAVAVFIIAVLFGLARLDSVRGASDTLVARLHFLKRQKALMILLFVTICGVGLEVCLIGLLTTFLMELRNFTQTTSKIGLIVFLSAVAAGRLLVGFFTPREKILDLLMLLLGLSVVFIGVLFFIRFDGFTYFMVLLTGAAISALFPLCVAYTGILYARMSGTALGILKMSIPIGGILFPLLLSLITRYSNFQISLALFPLIAACGFLVLLGSRNFFMRQGDPFVNS